MTPKEFIARFKVKCFWHFTDIRNLDSIRRHGLLRLCELEQRCIIIPAAGGNEWSHEQDRRIGLDKYVHLCLFNEHPMEYRAREDGRINKSRFLPIDPRILHIEDVRFAPDVSNKKGVPRLTLGEACEQMDFEVVYNKTDWSNPAVKERLKQAKKYELLIPVDIPIQMIRGL